LADLREESEKKDIPALSNSLLFLLNPAAQPVSPPIPIAATPFFPNNGSPTFLAILFFS